MAGIKSSGTDSNNHAARASVAASNASTALFSGLVGAIDTVVEDGRAALALQAGLTQGVLNTQAGEVERLSAKHGKDHPYVLAAQGRGQAMAGLRGDAQALAQAAAHAIEVFTVRSLFHGYVFDASGRSFPGAIVELQLIAAGAAAPKTQQARCDDKGYFRIAITLPTRGRTPAASSRAKAAQGAGDESPALSRVLRDVKAAALQGQAVAASEAGAASGQAEAGASAPESSAPAAYTSQVVVLDATSKATLLVDPLPPGFFPAEVSDGTVTLHTQFRLYVLP